MNEVLNVDNMQMSGVQTVPLSEDVDQFKPNVLEKPDTLRNEFADYPVTYAWVTGAVSVATQPLIHPMSSC